MSETTTTRKAPPTPKEKHWLVGHVNMMREDAIGMVKDFISKYGNIFSLAIPFHRGVVVADPTYARYVLLDNNKNYTKSLAYDMLKPLLGNGLLTSEGDFWKQQRKLIQPAFHKKKLEELTAMMVERSEHWVDRIDAHAAGGEAFDVLPEMTALTLDVISKAIFSKGVEDKAQIVGDQITYLNEHTVERLHQPFRLPETIPTPFNRKARKSIELLDKVIYEIIDERRREGVSKDDLLSMLIDAQDEETGIGMDNKQLRDEVMTIFLAGNETSSNALTWTLYLLSQHPEAEARMIAEIDQKLDSGVKVDFTTVNEFQYVRQVIDESMRVHPPVWIVGRRAIEADEIGGYYIAPQTNVVVPIIYLHHSPKYWDQPEKFMPERFAPEKRNSIDRYVYMPFGGGPRLCIGNNFAMLEMQIILITLYRRFRFRLREGFEVEQEPLVTLRPKNGMQMIAERR
ncbi:MAG: cytochrome P450 [Bacteroidetes bacterium]|nr:cytochrome P450 [Bacteroidota bacterium]